jgi:cytochrome oxidase assembly protein ShyY1
VTVTGVLQPSEGERASQVDVLTPLPVGQIAYLSTVELQEALPYPPEELYDGYLLLSSQEPAAREAPEQVAPQPVTDGSGRWRNLAYAFQWWLFAAAAVFLWVSLIRRAVSDHQTPAELG